jgi:glucosylglycerate synthase
MVEIGAAPEEIKQRLEQLGTVDVVIGIVDPKAVQNVGAVAATIRRGLDTLSKPTRAVVVLHREAAGTAAAAFLEQLENESLRLVTYSLPALDTSVTAAQTIAATYRVLSNFSSLLTARVCVVIGSSIETLTPQWIQGLAQPVLEDGMDLVTPCYAPRKFEGLLNSGILYPLTRALFGKQLQNPLGPDFGLSARLFDALLQIDQARQRTGAQFVLIGPEAVARGFKVSQAWLGTRMYPSVDWKNVDSVLAEILGPLFTAIEQQAPFWQHIRASEPVPTYGDPLPLAEESYAVDTQRLLERFRLGARNLQDIWVLVLPPTILLELKKADRLPAEQFRIPDELWVRIVYDFALAHRLRTIARDHLVRAMTPLYLGWLASYARQVEAPGAAVQKHLESLCTAYENAKPYFVSRWRWPDRFNS